jgi:hypothetical protein
MFPRPIVVIFMIGRMDDLAVRRRTYRLFVELGRAPRAGEVGDAEQVRSAWLRLHAEHALVLDAGKDELRMANPFSAVPTAYRVLADGRWWYANCAWDAFGVCSALHADGRIETSCADCGAPLTVEVRNMRPDDATLLFHCLVPAAHWWDDIGFT